MRTSASTCQVALGDDVRCLTTDAPLANITVTLFEDFDGDGMADGPAIDTTQSDANGFYQFSGLEVALAGDPNNLTTVRRAGRYQRCGPGDVQRACAADGVQPAAGQRQS